MQQSFQQTHEIFEKLKKVNIYHLNSSRRYMAEILPIRRKTLSNPSISIVKDDNIEYLWLKTKLSRVKQLHLHKKN